MPSGSSGSDCLAALSVLAVGEGEAPAAAPEAPEDPPDPEEPVFRDCVPCETVPPPESAPVPVPPVAVGLGVVVDGCGVAACAVAPGVAAVRGFAASEETLPDSLETEDEDEADGAADGEVSAQDVPENVLDEGSSAWARWGVSPMPMSTAVGMAAMAITLPAGTWILVSSDFLGAA
jgi:hypothetical protein